MASIDLNFSNTSPRPRKRLRSPDWRYQYVSSLLDDYRKPRKDDDKWAHELYHFMHCLRSQPADKVETYRDNNPDISDAFAIFENGSAYRCDLDTRIMAGYDFKEIADIIGRPSEVVEYYTHCFFDVLEHLDNKSYLHRWVLDPIMRIAPYSTEALWKRLALVGGRPMLEAVQNCSIDQIESLFESLFDNLLLAKGIQAANGITPGPGSAVDLINLAQNKIENRKRIEATTGAAEDENFTSQIVSVMLKSFTFGLLSEDDLKADPLRSGQHTTKELEEMYGDNPPKFLGPSPIVEEDAKNKE
jgi:hypothetical protein